MTLFSSLKHAAADTSRTALLLHRSRLLLALLFGATVTAALTYGLVRHVQDLIAGAQVSHDPVYWSGVARDSAYDQCYNGCNDCSDPNWAFNACAKTAKAVVPGVVCDANLMWNWKVEDRYPQECLRVVGWMYRDEALGRKKKKYRNQLACIILTVLAGVVGAAAAYCFIGSLEKKLDERRRQNPRQPRETQGSASPSPSRGSSGRRATKTRAIALKRLTAAATLGSLLPTKSRAYACTGYGKPVDVYFRSTNASASITALVHGWFSNCYDYICGCTSTGGTDTSCTPIYCTGVDYVPVDYVNNVTPSVVKCGFKSLNASEVVGIPGVRVANPWFERTLRVTVKVDKLNVTDETADEVLCLHGMVGQ